MAAGIACVALAGCASTGTKLEGPPIVLKVELDKTVYRTGDPLIATVTLVNRSRETIDLPRFNAASVKFMVGRKGLHARVHREPVHSNMLPGEPRRLEPGGSTSRKFVFTRATTEPGDFALMASFKGLVLDATYVSEAVYADAQPFEVTKEVALRRDRANGLILKEQALEIARASASGDVEKARAVLMPLGETGLYTWVVMLRRGSGSCAVQVDPYLGKVKPLEMKGTEGGPSSGESSADKASGTPGRPDPARHASDATGAAEHVGKRRM